MFCVVINNLSLIIWFAINTQVLKHCKSSHQNPISHSHFKLVSYRVCKLSFHISKSKCFIKACCFPPFSISLYLYFFPCPILLRVKVRGVIEFVNLSPTYFGIELANSSEYQQLVSEPKYHSGKCSSYGVQFSATPSSHIEERKL